MSTLTLSPRTRFAAPAATFAPSPAESRGLARDDVRLLLARPGRIRHRRFRDLADELAPGDLVVVNNSATVAAEMDATWRGRAVVAHLGSVLDDGHRVVELRTAPDAAAPVLDAAPGDPVALPGGVRATLQAAYPGTGSSPTGAGNRLWRAAIVGDLTRVGPAARPIAYGYLDRRYPLAVYQSVFGLVPGSSESPSAGLPFTDRLLTRLVSRGVGVAAVTLHTGLSSQEAGEAPQAEWYDVAEPAARLVNAARANGGRVVAVGTTVTRALESAAVDGALHPSRGWTDRVVSVAQPPQIVDGLVTGWHDPHASHLLLVEAVAGAELTQAAYDAAVRERYLWHEFGDSALFLPDR